MSTKTRVARVIPLIRLAPSVALLDYALPALRTLQVGDIVRVPFRSTSVRGVVWEMLSAEERTRPLKSVSSQTSEYLTAEQLAIARWMQAETCTPLNVIARSFMPAIKGARGERVRSGALQTTLTLAPTLQDRERVVKSWSQRLAAAGEATFVLCPSQDYASIWLSKLSESQTVFIHPQAKQNVKAMEKFRSPHTRFFVTTHAGLFAPFQKLHRVIIDLADDHAYFAFAQAPRVDIRRVAAKLAEVHGAKVSVLARWVNPPVAELAGSQKSELAPLPAAEVRVLDRSNERSTERKEIVPLHLVEQLAGTRTLWFHNRVAEAGRYTCSDCGVPVLCPTCDKPLRVATAGQLWCEQDNLRMVAPEHCHACKGVNFSNRSLGISATARTIAHSGVQVGIVDRLHQVHPESPHVVATEALARFPHLRFSAAVIVQADTLCRPGTYRGEEEFLDTVAFVRQFLPTNGYLYVPTFQPSAPAVIALANTASWLAGTLDQRMQLHYPPAGTLVLLRARERVRKRATQPLDPGFLPTGTQLVQQPEMWIIRCTQETREALLSSVRTNLHPTWEATVDPPRVL